MPSHLQHSCSCEERPRDKPIEVLSFMVVVLFAVVVLFVILSVEFNLARTLLLTFGFCKLS